jgi:hypothetical protein
MTTKLEKSNIKPDSPVQIQELVDTAYKNIDQLVDREQVLQRLIQQQDTKIFDKREALKLLLNKCNMGESYPVLANIMADDVKPDTVPKSLMSSFSIKDSRTKNYPNPTILALRNLLGSSYATHLKTVAAMMDELMVLSLKKASMESEVKKIHNLQGDTTEILNTNLNRVTELKNLQDTNAHLQVELYGIRTLFTSMPDSLTSQKNVVDYNLLVPRYSEKYVTMRGSILGWCKKYKDQIDEMTTEKPVGLSDLIDKIAYTFGASDTIPAKFTVALDRHTQVVLSLTKIIDEILPEMRNILKGTLDIAMGIPQPKGQGTPSLGNAEVDGLVSNSQNIVSSPANSTNAGQDTMQTTTLKINSDVLQSKKDATDLKSNLALAMKGGVAKLNEMMQNSKFSQNMDRMLLGMGLPVTFTANGSQNVRDGLREFVRKKFGDGNLPFEDEVIGVDSSGSHIYIKKDDAVQKDGGVWVRKTDAQAKGIKPIVDRGSTLAA